MTIRDRLSLAYLRRIVKTPAGRAFILRQLAEAESNGEAAIFDKVLRHVDDPQLQKMIKKHREDEVRHARMFAEAAARQGVPDEPIPAELRLIDKLDAAVGGIIFRGAEPASPGRGAGGSEPSQGSDVNSAKDVMEVYLLLQVVEERGITQFKMMARAFREVDPATAAVIDVIAADEERHLRYCQAISRRYAPGPETLAATLTHLRTVEARVFAEQTEVTSRYTMERGYFSGGPLARAFFGGLVLLTRGRGELPFTTYATTPVAAAA